MTQPPLGITARAIVDRIIDGDTMLVSLTIPVRIRLRDCWAPEITGANKLAGIESKKLLETMAPVGSKVRVHVPTTHVDALGGVLTFDRVLGEVYREDDCESLNELMVAAGAATRVKDIP